MDFSLLILAPPDLPADALEAWLHGIRPFLEKPGRAVELVVVAEKGGLVPAFLKNHPEATGLEMEKNSGIIGWAQCALEAAKGEALLFCEPHRGVGVEELEALAAQYEKEQKPLVLNVPQKHGGQIGQGGVKVLWAMGGRLFLKKYPPAWLAAPARLVRRQWLFDADRQPTGRHPWFLWDAEPEKIGTVPMADAVEARDWRYAGRYLWMRIFHALYRAATAVLATFLIVLLGMNLGVIPSTTGFVLVAFDYILPFVLVIIGLVAMRWFFLWRLQQLKNAEGRKIER